MSKSSAGSQSGFDLSHQGVIYHDARFEVQRLDRKYPFLAVGFGINATDQRIVLLQDRQGKVAILASRCRGIDLDFVIEVEQVQGTPTVPHERVERKKGCFRGWDLPLRSGDPSKYWEYFAPVVSSPYNHSHIIPVRDRSSLREYRLHEIDSSNTAANERQDLFWRWI